MLDFIAFSAIREIESCVFACKHKVIQGNGFLLQYALGLLNE